MKKLILLLIMLTTFTNVSYASFPVDTNRTDTSKTILKETIDEYHQRIEKQGFDLSNCMCESCRKGIPITEDIMNKSVNRKMNKKTLIVVLIVLLVVIVIVIYNFNKSLDRAIGEAFGEIIAG